KRLHDALAVIGHAVAPGDAKQERFCSSTKGAVQRLQKALGLPTTGEVDEATAERLSRIDQAKPRPLSTQPATTEFPGRARIRGTTPTPREIRAVQKVLASLGHAIPASDISKGEVSGVTLDALHALQDATGTTRSDNLDAMTLALVNTEAHHAWFVRSRTRVARVQDLLAAVGYEVPEDERETRTLGTQSRAALAAFRSARGLPPIARVDEATYAALEDQALRFRLSSKRQVGLVQHKLHRLAGALKLPTRIDPAEYERFRGGLLRHIGIEEKILLAEARTLRGGEPLPVAHVLKQDHSSLATLLVATPTLPIVAAVRRILAAHNPLEEDEGGMYDQVDALLTPSGAEALLLRVRGMPEPPLAPWNDNPRVIARIGRLIAGDSGAG
ncbi:MAG: peptidoglycan-binding protein, partial [Planctomycetaceae bacterium]|nr:peptidoglycan-binding protein [Planctomycetaceae bacterium]